MHALRDLFLLSSIPLALAQYNYPTNSATTTGAASAPSSVSASNVQIVTVGDGGLTFSPNTTTASVGSFVEFHFFAPAHSVAQSPFSAPCQADGTGFYSGIFHTSSGENSTVFRVEINDTNPIWYYCSYPGHCQAGMVGVINPPSDTSKNLAAYAANAKTVASSVEPKTVQGGVIGAADTASGTGSGSSTATTTGAPATSSTSKPSGAQGMWNQIAHAAAVAGTLAIAVGFLMS